jgi:tRNA G10  N-methylase Trm11
MHKSVAILGRQPALGLAELESLYGAGAVVPFGDSCLLDIDAADVDFGRLGGSMRIGSVIAEIDASKWETVEKHIIANIADIFPVIDGKLMFGISAFGRKADARKIAKTALLIKKAIKASGQSVRMVPHKGVELNSATVLYNKLHRENGFELLIITHEGSTIIAKTAAIQDIDAYAARDQARPKRDAKVGMLPPKLAQIIVNLSVGEATDSKSKICVLDPFCGTGVTLQEAMLMDYDIYGSDIDPRMVEYTIANLEWLDGHYPDVGDYRRIEMGDATNHTWDFSKVQEPGSKICVAGETFLGHPLAALPPGDQLSKIIYEANVINHRFLLNIVDQLKPGTRLCLAVPTWRGRHEFLHLPMLDHLTEMGYTRMKFKHVENEDLIYHRENQIVGRELLVLLKR